MRLSVIAPSFLRGKRRWTEPTAALLFGGLLFIGGCQPALNWREVRSADLALTVLLPCKPDQGQRAIEIGAYTARISMLGCEADGGLYAVSRLALTSDIDAAQVQAAWQQSVVQGVSASTFKTGPYSQPGASPTPQPILLRATGRTSQGRAVQLQAIWFAHRESLYHAVLYQQALNAEAADTFFSGLKIQ